MGSRFTFPEAEAKVDAKSRVVGSGRGRNGRSVERPVWDEECERKSGEG